MLGRSDGGGGGGDKDDDDDDSSEDDSDTGAEDGVHGCEVTSRLVRNLLDNLLFSVGIELLAKIEQRGGILIVSWPRKTTVLRAELGQCLESCMESWGPVKLAKVGKEELRILQ